MFCGFGFGVVVVVVVVVLVFLSVLRLQARTPFAKASAAEQRG